MTQVYNQRARQGINAIRDLTPEEWANYSKASQFLMYFSGNQRVFSMVLLNYADFIGILEKYSKEYAKNHVVKRSRSEYV